MNLKRFAIATVLACAAATAIVAAAPAGGIADQPCPDAAGENTKTCPPGTEGVPYSIKFLLGDGVGCAPGDDTWHIINGSPPPGLSLSTDGTLSGTPTQAGAYKFWIEMRLPDYWIPDPNPEPPDESRGCNGTADTTQEEITLVINPGLPKLTIGPESAPVGTVSTAYSLQMTSTVGDAKTWSIVAGALPGGLAIDAGSGLISGTPTTVGTFGFTVRAVVNADARSDTKELAITVRTPVTLRRSSAPLVSEVGLAFSYPFVAAGGSEQYTWALTGGALPTGVELGPTGELAGVPEEPGRFPFTVTATDSEGRVGRFTGRVLVAETLTVFTTELRPGTAGRPYRARLRVTGGVKPTTWKIVRGPLPRGVRFDRQLGKFAGVPRTAGRYRIVVEVTDALGVKDRATVVLLIRPAAKQ